jgi:hypothetical protein
MKYFCYQCVFLNQIFFIHFCCMQKIMTSLDRVEESLAEARASIRKAIMSRNYSTSGNRFVTKGSIYRNPYAFHQLSLRGS